MNKKTKRGFTIVELVIVIAVIAILAAVLIPTFASVIQKANLSSDQQAVRQMNVTLASEGATSDIDIYDVFDILAEDGMDAKDYKALSSGTTFFWAKDINRVLMVKNNAVIYPEEYKNVTYTDGNWFSLSRRISAEKVSISDGKATVSNANQLAYAIERAEAGKVNEIKLKGTIDMMGSSVDVAIKGKNTLSIVADSEVVIKNATAIEATTTHENKTPGHDGVYNTALFPAIASGQTLVLKNVTFENVHVRDINASNAAILVANNSGTLVLENVVIKNSSVTGHHNVGALVGNNSASKIQIKGNGVTMENVQVLGVGGRIGKLIGHVTSGFNNTKLSGDAKITMTNVTSGIYQCVANTGSYKGQTLGLADGQITSTEVLGDGTVECKARPYFVDTLIGAKDATTAETIFAGYIIFDGNTTEEECLEYDKQSVETFNEILATTNEVEDIDCLPEAITALAEAGCDLQDYKPLTKDHYFYFTIIDGTPTVILADKEDKIVFPAGMEKEDTTSWYSLLGITPVEKVDISDNNAVVNNGAQLAYVIDSAKTGKEKVSNVTLNADVNLRGAGVDFGNVKSDLTIDGNGKTLAGARSDDNQNTVTGGEYAGHDYGFGFVGEIPAGKVVTIKDVTLDNFFSGNTAGTHEKGANTVGLIAGYVKGTLILENVTIKNSTVYGYQKVGAIAGQLIGNGSITLKNVKFENVTVIGSTEVAKISGIMNSTASITLDHTTTDGITVESFTSGQFKGSEIIPNAELTWALGTLSLSKDSYYFISNNAAKTSFWIAGAVTTDWAWYAPAEYTGTLRNLMYNGKNATYNGTDYEFSSYPFTYKG